METFIILIEFRSILLLIEQINLDCKYIPVELSGKMGLDLWQVETHKKNIRGLQLHWIFYEFILKWTAISGFKQNFID